MVCLLCLQCACFCCCSGLLIVASPSLNDVPPCADRDSYAQRKYTRDTTKLNPDLIAYNRQKEQALGLAPGTIVPVNAKTVEGSTALTAHSKRDVSRAVGAMENLYRDANTLAYGDNKASDEAIDRVVGKMNEE
jgi:pre-mRNA-splicing factor SYF2